MTASGDVSDYTAEVRDSIVGNFAAAAGVAQSRVSLDVAAASVRLSITIASSTQAGAEAAQTSLAPSLSSSVTAAALMPSGFTVESTPTLAVTEAPPEGTALSPPPPLSSTDDEPTGGGGGGALIGAGAAAAVLLLIPAVLLLKRRKLARLRQRAKTMSGEEVEWGGEPASLEAAQPLPPALPSAQSLPSDIISVDVPPLADGRIKACESSEAHKPVVTSSKQAARVHKTVPADKAVTIKSAGGASAVETAGPKQRRMRGPFSARADKKERERQMALRLQAAFRGYRGRQAHEGRRMDMMREFMDNDDDESSSSMSSRRSVGWSSLLTQLQLPSAEATNGASSPARSPESAALALQLNTERSSRTAEREGPGRQSFTNRTPTPTATPKSVASDGSKVSMATLSPEELGARRDQSSRARAESKRRVLGAAASSRPASRQPISPRDRGAPFKSDRGIPATAVRSPSDVVGKQQGSAAETAATALAARSKAAGSSRSDEQLDV